MVLRYGPYGVAVSCRYPCNPCEGPLRCAPRAGSVTDSAEKCPRFWREAGKGEQRSVKCSGQYRGTSLIGKSPPPLGPPYGPRHIPTVGS